MSIISETSSNRGTSPRSSAIRKASSKLSLRFVDDKLL